MIVVNLGGGLGNQMFLYAFGMALQMKMGGGDFIWRELFWADEGIL